MSDEDSLELIQNQILVDSIEKPVDDDCNLSTELVWDSSSTSKVKVIVLQKKKHKNKQQLIPDQSNINIYQSTRIRKRKTFRIH